MNPKIEEVTVAQDDRAARPAMAGSPQNQPGSIQVIPLRPPGRWHDPLQLIQDQPPSQFGRIVLWSVSILFLVLVTWATVGKLDIIATAEGKLATQTLVKIVQPAEPGIVKEILVDEGDAVKAGQVLARLDTTLAQADKNSISSDLAIQQMQARRLEAELADQPMLPKAGDDPTLYAQVHGQYAAHRKAFTDGLDQEKSLLTKVEHEQRSALQILAKLEQTLPTYKKSADAFTRLEKEGFISAIAAAEKQREAIEKSKDLDAQQSMVAALNATIAAQNKKISQLTSTYRSELEKELADVRARVAQLQPNLDKTLYKEGLMELRAPQDGVIKDLATTTIGAVVQPGTVVLTLVPKGEQLYADVNIKNDDVGFVQLGQKAQVKLAAYPFQKYGMLTGKVIHISADATEPANSQRSANADLSMEEAQAAMPTYKARIQL
ncbi:MAG: HlyD family type I secretion periplasmic adaptor subunit, partial [Burkholderiaceae bacterium]